MTDAEMKQWIAVTENSRYQWTEDEITRLNGRGALYYLGGKDGIYIRIDPEGKLSAGTYEGALPHIGEAFFTRRAVIDCGDFNQAFQKAVELGGQQFLQDMFSAKPAQILHSLFFLLAFVIAIPWRIRYRCCQTDIRKETAHYDAHKTGHELGNFA